MDPKGKVRGESQPFVSRAVGETLTFSRGFAKRLKPGDVLALTGDLGSGKTTFIKGIALGLGLKNPDEVKSPTFALMHLYPTRIPLYHFDFYRLEKPEDIRAIGFEEFVHDPRVISCIEWPEKAKDFLPARTRHIRMSFAGKNSRQIEFFP